MRFKLLITTLFMTTFLLAGEVKISVATNVSYAIKDLVKEFNKKNPDTKVQVILGSSGKLTAQISNGAPYQLFMSADMRYPNRLYEKKIAITKPVVYAQGKLALLSHKELDFSKGINLLKDKKIRKIAIANPKIAPYGKASLEAIKNAGILDSVKDKFVYAESISQSVSYAVTAVDIGFIAKSSLYDKKMRRFKEGKNWVEIDCKLYTPISQGVVMLKKGDKNGEVLAFYDFILSVDAKKIFEKYGYLLP